MITRLEPAVARGWVLRSRAGQRAARAFTMIELMVVVAVMGIVLAMGIPAIRSALNRDPMSQAVVDVLNACQGDVDHAGARAKAIMTGRTTELRIYPHEKKIEVAGGFTAQFSDQIGFKMLDVNFLDCMDADYATVRFYPNGTCDEFNLILVSASGEARRITLDVITATPQVINIQ